MNVFLYRVQTMVGWRHVWICQACGAGGLNKQELIVRREALEHPRICWAQLAVPSGFRGVVG